MLFIDATNFQTSRVVSRVYEHIFLLGVIHVLLYTYSLHFSQHGQSPARAPSAWCISHCLCRGWERLALLRGEKMNERKVAQVYRSEPVNILQTWRARLFLFTQAACQERNHLRRRSLHG